MANRIGVLAVLLLVVTTTGFRTKSGMCSRCNCEHISQESLQILKLDCSRLHGNDVDDLLGMGDRRTGDTWKIPFEADLTTDILSIVLDSNSVHRLRPLPPLDRETKNETSYNSGKDTGNDTSKETGNGTTTKGSLSNSTKSPNCGSPRLELSFRSNHLSGIEPGAFVSVSETLTSLDLSDNEITFEALPASVFRGQFSQVSYEPMPVLEKLNLARNQLHALDAKLFEHIWKTLRVLNLQGNPLGNSLDLVTESALSTLKGLRELNLADTGLSSYPKGLAHVLQSLESLRLDGNAFTTVPDSLSISQPSLIYLNINRNPIKSINNNSFHSTNLAWSKLNVLDMVAMPELETVDKGAFESLSKLQILRCCYNRKLSYFDKEAFRKVEGWGTEWGRWREFNLKELELQSNALELLSPDVVPWAYLDSVDLQSNPWACNCSLKPLADVMRMYIMKKNPTLSVGLHCASPTWFKGLSVLTTYPSEDDPDANTNSIWLKCGESTAKRRFWRSRGAVASALVAVCVAALTSLALVVFLVMLVRRSVRLDTINMPGTVRYVRAPPTLAEDDDEHVIMDMRWTTKDTSVGKSAIPVASGASLNQHGPSLS